MPVACVVVYIIFSVIFEVEEKMATEDAEECRTSETDEYGIERETLPIFEI